MARRGRRIRQGFRLTVILVFLVILLALLGIMLILGSGGISDILNKDKVNEIEGQFQGLDVARYQGTVDWAQVAQSGVEFAMIRVGYRDQETGEIKADTNARYNLQEAEKHGIKLGAYFFSTAISEEEAQEEANWVADFIAPHSITYPVAYNCENYADADSRQYRLSKRERTDNAIAFLKQIEKRGYEGMFYASKNEMENDEKWQVSRIETDYKIWVAQYPAEPYPATEQSSYSRIHHMWQYTRTGQVVGIPTEVDVDIAYFGYDGVKKPKSDEVLDPATPDPEALMEFRPTNQFVTAKSETNLRDIPSQDEDATVLYTLQNGQLALRTGVSDSGWSRVEFEGKIYYAVTSYLTTQTGEGTEAEEDAPAEPIRDPDGDGLATEFRAVEEYVTAKELTNLRNIPSTTRADSTVVGQLKNGELAKRTGINEDVGWSRLEIDGTVCYAVNSLLTTDVENISQAPEAQLQFREVGDTVTAKKLVNLRTMPSTDDPNCKVVGQLKNGDRVVRNGVSDDGWSRVIFEGQTLYCWTEYIEVIS